MGSPVDSAVVDALQRGQWSPGDLRSGPNPSLQATTVRSSSAAVSRRDGALSQPALFRAGISVLPV